ncbi:S1 family peptidase [Streptomyces lanatus]|uniref:S1 family peptidase n=1 Tax=Streptomyces lanatus TaxID=66900 RepID=A0ABV1XRW3_9ACTN|nr:S1 family peptidase [Streptomyces lanatus]GHH08485.1 serine protease [Streptomyces lanatus]
MRSSWSRRAALSPLAAALLFAGTLLSPSDAFAAPDPHDIPVAGGISGRSATALSDELGASRTGGFYVDRETDRLVVNVTDEAAAGEVREAGGIARRVTHSMAELDAVTDAFNKSISIPGTTWGTDVKANRVDVQADATVSAADYARLLRTAEPFGSTVRVTRADGRLEKTISGGNFIESSNGLVDCSLGFNVRKKSDPNSLWFLTAGHCLYKAAGVADWRNGAGVYLGYEAGGSYPANDYGLIRHYNADIGKPGNVYLHNGSYQDITHSRDPGADEYLCSSGWKTGYICGYVLQKNVTANYGDGNVGGLFRWTNCIEGGDSGGPVFHGDAALGLNSGKITWNDGCDSLGQQVNEALAWSGTEVY